MLLEHAVEDRPLSLFSSLLGDPRLMPEPPVSLIQFTRFLYVLCCLCDAEGAARIAEEVGDARFHDRAQQAGLTEGEGFYA